MPLRIRTLAAQTLARRAKELKEVARSADGYDVWSDAWDAAICLDDTADRLLNDHECSRLRQALTPALSNVRPHTLLWLAVNYALFVIDEVERCETTGESWTLD